MLAENLIKLRKNRKLSQNRVSQMINVPRTTYSGWERGISEPNICMLIKLAKYHSVTVDILINSCLFSSQIHSPRR